MRESGILFPVFSLASKFGIGCFSGEAFEFVDFLKESGQGFWQILPLLPTGYGDSPYQPLSAFGGNPYFVSPEVLINEGLLTWDECNSFNFGWDEERIDYGALYENREKLLRLAFGKFLEKGLEEQDTYKEFRIREKYWLEDYCLYQALKKDMEGKSWQDWDEPLKLRDKKALAEAKDRLEDSVKFYEFVQYEFDRQWDKIHKYAGERNIKIIGDIPFYVSLDSADVWAHSEAFKMDKDMTPTFIAGTPADDFSPKGQIWGNPVYDWDKLKDEDYSFWMERMKRSYRLYDVVRIDYFHGFSGYFQIPYGDEDAVNGELCQGPGNDFFRVLKKETGEFVSSDSIKIIAEDLGAVTEDNKKFLEETGIPGMKILQYAFTGWDSIYMPYKLEKNCVVYTGTHDNMTTRTWLESINDGSRDFVKRYLNSNNNDYGALVWDMIKEVYRSVGNLAIIPLQDYLVKGNEARINTPGAGEGNWQWRLKPNFLSRELSISIKTLAETYGRIPKGKEKETVK